jgi:hypothetical protein
MACASVSEVCEEAAFFPLHLRAPALSDVRLQSLGETLFATESRSILPFPHQLSKTQKEFHLIPDDMSTPNKTGAGAKIMSSRLANMKVRQHRHPCDSGYDTNIVSRSSCSAPAHPNHRSQALPNNPPRKDSACPMAHTTPAQAQHQDLRRQRYTPRRRRNALRLLSERPLQKGRQSGISAYNKRLSLRSNRH